MALIHSIRSGMTVSSKWGVLLSLALVVLGSALATGSFESDTKINLIEPDDGWSLARKTSDDTVRADPLDRLRKYRGGYDITSKHYWSSTVFTGIHGYAIGLLWLLSGVLLGGLLVVSSCITSHKKNYNAPKKHTENFKQCSKISLILAALFTILAITASGVVLGENAKFYSRARKVVSIIIETADNASETLYEAKEALNSISKAMEASNYLITDTSLIQSTSEELDSAAASILIQARDNRRLINNVLKISFITTTVTIALSLVAVMTLSISGFLCFDKIVGKLIALCWILGFLCWILFGMYFFVDRFASDTCTALKNFQQDPYNNTLSSILPCKDMLPAKYAMSDVRGQIYSLVQEVNANLLMQSTSVPFAIQICDPFSGPPEYNYQPDDCPTGTIRIGDIPKVLKQLTCSSTNSNSNCANKISYSKLEMIKDYATSIQTLLNAFPAMESLVECQTVEDAFTEITTKHCTPIKRFIRDLWTATLFLSILMVILVLTWIVKVYRVRKYHFTDKAVNPQNPGSGHTLESGEGQQHT